MLQPSARALGSEPRETIRGKLYPTSKKVGHFGARPYPHFGTRLRVESVRTILRFEEALGLRVKLITENGNVIGPLEEGDGEADQGTDYSKPGA